MFVKPANKFGDLFKSARNKLSVLDCTGYWSEQAQSLKMSCLLGC